MKLILRGFNFDRSIEADLLCIPKIINHKFNYNDLYYRLYK